LFFLIRRLLWSVIKIKLSIVVIGNVPIKAFHNKIVVLMVNSHKEIAHPDVNSHSIQEILSISVFIINWVLDKVDVKFEINVRG